MRLARYRVLAVYTEPTKYAGLVRYAISLSPVDDGVPGTIVDTLNEWAASLGQRAAETGAIVKVGYTQTKRGNNLVSINLLEAA